MHRGSGIGRILIIIIIVLLAAPLSFGQEKAEETRPIEIRPPWMMPAKTGKAAGPVKESFTQKDLKVDFTLASLTTEQLVEGEYARISFRLTDASSGAPVPSLYPGVWIDAAVPSRAGEKMSCKDRISVYLKRVMGMGPLLDLTHYYILVMNRDASVAVIDPLVGITGKTSLLASIPLAKPGADWVKGQDHKRLFVTMPLARQLAVIDTDTFKVLRNIDAGEAPTRVALQPDFKYLWVGNNAKEGTEGGVTAIDATSLRVAGQIPTGLGHHEIAFSDDSRYVYVTNRGSGTVSVIDTQQMKKVKDIATGPVPISIAFSALSRSLYVADGKEGTISVVDGKSHDVTARIQAKPGLGPMALAAEGRWLLVVNSRDNAVHAVETSGNRIAHTIAVGPRPYQISLTRAFAFVRCIDTERVYMINLLQLQKDVYPPVTNFAAGSSPPKDGGELGLAPAVAPAVKEAAVYIVSQADKAIYYYMEGMNFPMSSFQNYGYPPQAVDVIDRSLREVEAGLHTAVIKAPPAGSYEVAFVTESPNIVHCFPITVNADPAVKKGPVPPAVEYLAKDTAAKVGGKSPFRFRLRSPETGDPVAGVRDVMVRFFSVGSTARTDLPATEVEPGVYEAVIAVSQPGTYYVYIGSPSLKVKFGDIPFTTLLGIPERRGAAPAQGPASEGDKKKSP
jgi:YVTN family beta-propeller protein